MKISLSSNLLNDLAVTLDAQLRENGTINVSQLAETIRRRHEAENVALEDIATGIMQLAQTRNAIMEFDSLRLPA